MRLFPGGSRRVSKEGLWAGEPFQAGCSSPCQNYQAAGSSSPLPSEESLAPKKCFCQLQFPIPSSRVPNLGKVGLGPRSGVTGHVTQNILRDTAWPFMQFPSVLHACTASNFAKKKSPRRKQAQIPRTTHHEDIACPQVSACAPFLCICTHACAEVFKHQPALHA